MLLHNFFEYRNQMRLQLLSGICYRRGNQRQTLFNRIIFV